MYSCQNYTSTIHQTIHNERKTIHGTSRIDNIRHKMASLCPSKVVHSIHFVVLKQYFVVLKQHFTVLKQHFAVIKQHFEHIKQHFIALKVYFGEQNPHFWTWNCHLFTKNVAKSSLTYGLTAVTMHRCGCRDRYTEMYQHQHVPKSKNRHFSKNTRVFFEKRRGII